MRIAPPVSKPCFATSTRVYKSREVIPVERAVRILEDKWREILGSLNYVTTEEHAFPAEPKAHVLPSFRKFLQFLLGAGFGT